MRNENTPAFASSSNIGRSKPARTRSIGIRAVEHRRDAVAQRDLVVGELEVHDYLGSRGRPSTRSPMMLRWICGRAGRDRQRERSQSLLDELVVVDVQRISVRAP